MVEPNGPEGASPKVSQDPIPERQNPRPVRRGFSWWSRTGQRAHHRRCRKTRSQKGKTPARWGEGFHGGAERDRTVDLYTASIYLSKDV